MFDLRKDRFDTSRIFRAFDRLESRISNTIGTTFRTDVVEDSDRYVLSAELPGFERDEISIDITDNELTITAQHRGHTDITNGHGETIRRERNNRSYSRGFDISDIKAEEITADYKNGILILELPKINVTPKNQRHIIL